MSIMTPADMRTAVYKVGKYVKADGTDMPEADIIPNIPISLTGKHRVVSSNNTADKNKHFRQGFYPFAFSRERDTTKKLVATDVDAYKLNFRLPVVTDTTNKIIYLPFFDKNITSTEIPVADASVSYFITDVLSGCSFYIDQLPDARGDLICYHANAIHSPATAATVMDDQLVAARKEAYPTAVNKFSLRKDRYYAEALKLENNAKTVKGRTDVRFAGGTMVIGFRVAGKWEFWYQTFGRLTYKEPSKSLNPFKPNELVLKNEVEKIVDVQCFWKEGQ